MPRISDIVSSFVPSRLCAGGSSSQGPSSSRAGGHKPPADPELEGWKRRGYPSEDRASAVKTIESSEKYKRPRVDLSRLALEELPSAMSRLASTEVLNLSGNQLKSWPAELAGLGNLKELNVSFNKIGNIPAEIGALSRLTSLNAQNNWISVNAINAGMAGLRGLRELNLSTNRLTEFPKVILELPQLKKLSLADNQIRTLPAIDRLHQLTELDLSKNPLGAIPDGPDHPEGSNGAEDARLPAARLPAGLKKLKLAETLLEDIPASAALPEHVGKLQELKLLDVSSNPLLTQLPIALRTFRTAGPDKVKSTGRKVELTVLHSGTGVAQGLEQGGRLLGSASLDEANQSNGSSSGTDASDWDANARRYIRQTHRQARADLAAPPGNGPPPDAGGTPQNPTVMYANVVGPQGLQPTLPPQAVGAGQGVYPPPAGTSVPYTYPPAMPNAATAFPAAGAGGMFGAQAPTAGLQTPAMAAGQTNPMPAMPFPQAAFGLQAGAMDPRTMLMQLGVQALEQQLAQLRTAFGFANQQVGQVPNPYGAGQFQPAYAPAGLPQAAQYPAPPAWAAQQAVAPQAPVNTAASQHQEEMMRRNSAILRDQQMKEVCATIPELLNEPGIDAVVAAIKSNVMQAGLSEYATRYTINDSLIGLGRKLYRQRAVDTIARRDALNRADPRISARALSIAYQAMLAGPDELDLVGPIRKLAEHLDQGTIRSDLFSGMLPPQTLLEESDKVLAEVRAMEAGDGYDTGFSTFLYQQKFWQEHTRLEDQHVRNTIYTHMS